MKPLADNQPLLRVRQLLQSLEQEIVELPLLVPSIWQKLVYGSLVPFRLSIKKWKIKLCEFSRAFFLSLQAPSGYDQLTKRVLLQKV
jgi:hypothetical protein